MEDSTSPLKEKLDQGMKSDGTKCWLNGLVDWHSPGGKEKNNAFISNT